MECLVHEKHACGFFVETSLPDCMMNSGNNDAFSTRFCWILLAYLDRLVAT